MIKNMKRWLAVTALTLGCTASMSFGAFAANTTEIESNNTWQKATLLTQGVKCSGVILDLVEENEGVIEVDQDGDWYALQVEAGKKYRLTFEPKPIDEFDEPRIDIYFYQSIDAINMYNSGNKSMTATVDSKDANYLDFTSETTGTSYLACYGYDDGIFYEVSYDTICNAIGHTLETVNAKEASCIDTGYTGDEVCTVCDTVVSTGQSVPKTSKHEYSKWKTTKKATVFKTGTAKRTCSICGKSTTKSIKKVKPTVQLNKASILLKPKKSTTIKAGKLAYGDSVKSWSSNKKNVVTVKKSGKNSAKLIAKANGTATITVKLASGKTAKAKVTVTDKTIGNLQTMAAMGIKKAYSSAKYPSTLNLNKITYKTNYVTSKGDPISRMVLRLYGANSSGGYSDIYVVLIACKSKKNYAGAKYDNGYYYYTSVYKKDPGSRGTKFSNKKAMKTYTSKYKAKALPYD